MGSTRIELHRIHGPVATFDAQGALDTLDQQLGGYRHPVPRLLRQRALATATGIAARASGPQGAEVTGRLRTILRSHGIFVNDLRPR